MNLEEYLTPNSAAGENKSEEEVRGSIIESGSGQIINRIRGSTHLKGCGEIQKLFWDERCVMQCLAMHKLYTILVDNKTWRSQYLLKITTPFPR